MSVELVSIRRMLCIANRLKVSPASRPVLMARVNRRVGDHAYGDCSKRPGIARFEHDLGRLRDIGVNITYQSGEYVLQDASAIYDL